MRHSSGMAVFPFYHHQQVLRAMLISCPDDFRCLKTEMEVIRLILEQASGKVFRTLEHERQIQEFKTRIDQVCGYQGMVGKNPKILVIYKLIQGESGTGKEIVARALHEESLRVGHSFVVINCSAYPATLLESELFGHEKRAFNGAGERKIGKFEKAGSGIRSIKFNIRIVAVTNRNLLDEVKLGHFREDLFYRLNVIPINLPPLRDRKNDVPLLAGHFLEKFANEQHKKIISMDPETLRTLVEYDWPGNIRELENSIEYAVTLAKSDRIFPGDLPPAPLLQAGDPCPGKNRPGFCGILKKKPSARY